MPGLCTPLRQLALVTRFGGIGCEVDLALNKTKTVKTSPRPVYGPSSGWWKKPWSEKIGNFDKSAKKNSLKAYACNVNAQTFARSNMFKLPFFFMKLIPRQFASRAPDPTDWSWDFPSWTGPRRVQSVGRSLGHEVILCARSYFSLPAMSEEKGRKESWFKKKWNSHTSHRTGWHTSETLLIGGVNKFTAATKKSKAARRLWGGTIKCASSTVHMVAFTPLNVHWH